MPYIKQIRRKELVDAYQAAYSPILSPGELNFVITSVVREYLHYHGVAYQTINDIVGALEGAKLEFYRRVAAPYENAKMAENGDVYE